MFSIDWKIKKRLLDAGLSGDTVYICRGRGSGKLETERQMIERLEAAGRTVIQIRPEDIRTARRMSEPVRDNDIIKAIYEAIDILKQKERPMYLPEYEMLKDFYVLDKTKNATPYLHWIKSNPYCTTSYSKYEEDGDGT